MEGRKMNKELDTQAINNLFVQFNQIKGYDQIAELVKTIPNSYQLERIVNASAEPALMQGQNMLVKIPGIEQPYLGISKVELKWPTPIILDIYINEDYGEKLVSDKNIIKFKKAIITAKAKRESPIEKLEREVRKWIRELSYEPDVKLYLRDGKEVELPQVNGTPVFYVINGTVSYKPK